ncbi:hypothetical protein CTI12_AA356880 [Artemisia annua]|uniref:CCHC-type domain-containing protein n=1 Tax=Artemisia annua TaxID=35608 RepID=A0A2U1M948_ARTAN|nr:hypothetical protein CTI12_AA356880 [Artemisia annua]
MMPPNDQVNMMPPNDQVIIMPPEPVYCHTVVEDQHYEQDKRETPRDEKKKNCPSGKSSCRCWLCKEEGHYANNCPKKNSNTAKPMIEIFNLVKQVGYEPLEDSDFDSETKYIAYISESEYSNDE